MSLSLPESRLFGRIYFDYRRNTHGIIETIDEEADVIRKIFFQYLKQSSCERIQKYLFEAGVPSPSGKSNKNRELY